MRLGPATAVMAPFVASVDPAIGPATAADMPAYDASAVPSLPIVAPQTFGSGWYPRDGFPTLSRNGSGIG